MVEVLFQSSHNFSCGKMQSKSSERWDAGALRTQLWAVDGCVALELRICEVADTVYIQYLAFRHAVLFTLLENLGDVLVLGLDNLIKAPMMG